MKVRNLKNTSDLRTWLIMKKIINYVCGNSMIIGILLFSSPATSTTVNFDEPEVSLIGINNFYPDVQFHGIPNLTPLGIPYPSGPYPAPETLPTIIGEAELWWAEAPGKSPPAYAVGQGEGYPGNAGILMTFDNPITKLTITGLDGGNGVDGSDTEEMTLTAYNTSGNKIGQNHFVNQFVEGAIRGTIEYPGMKHIAFNYTSGNRFYGIDDLDFIMPSVSIDNADLVANNVDITLRGLGSSTPGPLSIDLIGNNNTFHSIFNNGQNVGEGSYSLVLDRLSIPIDIYTKIIATWKLSTGDVISQDYLISPAWRVLGLIRHSQYNTPAEVACSGTSQTAWVFDTNCNFIQTTLNSRFVTQTYINGTGRSIQHGVIKYSKLCPQKSYPKGASTSNSFLLVNEITGSCNRQMTNTYQAAYPNPAKSSVITPKCGDNTLLVENNNNNKAEKQIQDYCPACKDGNHIDNYTDEEACSGSEIGDLGNFWTANIGR
ncbi:MAG: hypothetical protein ACU841_09440 [Gammaproteobacteria bacterium]